MLTTIKKQFLIDTINFMINDRHDESGARAIILQYLNADSFTDSEIQTFSQSIATMKASLNDTVITDTETQPEETTTTTTEG